MKNGWHDRWAGWLTFAVILIAAPASRAQDASTEQKGIDSGNYNIQQTIEAGYRLNWINGNINTYNTFVNLGQGARLLDYSLDMHSLDHNGLLFDSLNFYNFGYGGDPDNVTRLRLQKNHWYDFTYLFRRDKNFWDWSLLANPLNSPITPPASPAVFPANPNPNTVLITASPHSLDLVRRMQDFDLTLRPESNLRFRLGYSRNVDEGPALTSLDGGTETILNQNYRVTTNSYHLGADIRYLPKTTISYDQFFKSFKQDTLTFDAVGSTTPFTPLFPPGFNQFQLANGSPVDLGAVWTSSAPCATPVIANTVPPTVTPTCNGFFNGPLTLPANNGFPAVTGTLPGYSLFARPRNFMPTEHISFQSNYFTNLQMSGSFAYSTGATRVNDLLESQDFWSPKSLERGVQTAGPAKAKQYSATADFMAVYSINEKTRIRDVFRFDNWRTPSMWTSFAETFVAGAVGPGGPVGMLAPISTLFFSDPAAFAATCTTAGNFNQINCPQHSSSSDPDFSNQFWQRTLSEDTKSNTIQLEHDFNKRLSARAGFLYTNHKIGDFNAVTDILKVYLPGGQGGNSTSAFFAARGDCAFDNGALPANCTLNPATGIVTEFGPEAGNDTSVNITNINEYSLLVGLTARPIDKLRINGDFQFGSNDNAFVRPDARNLQVYKIHATYRPTTWASVEGAIDIHENRDNVFTVNDLEHDRRYSFSTTLSPNSKLAIDLGYTYFDFFTNIAICYASGVAGQPTTLCPIINSGDSTLGATSRYSSTDHFVFADMIWKPYKRVTVALGFAGNFTRGYSTFFNQPQFGSSSSGAPAPQLAPVIINANTPSGTLNFNYLKPSGSVAVDIYKGLSYKAAWNYYGFNEKGPPDPTTLSPIGARDFNGSTATFSLRYSF